MGYEFSVINSFLQYFIWFFLFNSEKLNLKIRNKLKLLIILFFIPIFISLISETIFGYCSFIFGLKFYVMFVLPSSFLGYSLYEFIRTLKIKYQKSTFILFTFFILSDILVELICYPQIYFYNHILGFFPGTIYDELIKIDLYLALSRLLTITVGIFLIIAGIFINNRIVKICLGLTLFGILFVLKPYLGLSTNYVRLESELNNIENTNHFTIYFDKTVSKEDKNRIGLLHEYYYERVKEELGFSPIKQIKSFIYSNNYNKGKLFGSFAADVTKPWLYQIHIGINSIERNLLHEIIHIFSAEIGITPLKLAYGFSPALIEGFAMAIEEQIEPKRNLDMFAFHSIKYFDINPKHIFKGLNFFNYNSSVGYILSGSFLKYIKNTYGNKKLFEYYKYGSIAKTNIKYNDNVFKSYLKYINNLQFNYNKHKAIYYFGYPPFVNKKCARYVAYKLEYIANIYNSGKYFLAEREYKKLFKESNNYNAFYGFILSLFKEKKFYNANRVLSKVIMKTENTNIYYPLLFLIGKTEVFTNNKQSKCFENLLHYNVSETFNLEVYKLKELTKTNTELSKEYIVNETIFNFNKLASDTLKILFMNSNNVETKNFINKIIDDDLKQNKYMITKLEILAEEYFIKGDYEFSKKIINICKYLNVEKDKESLYFSKLQKINWFIKKDIKRK